VTDGTGRYITPWVTPGKYTITFELSGFETHTVTVQLGGGETGVLDQQLALAALSETVQVIAPAPAPPPEFRPPARPEPRPVDEKALASVCGPREARDFSVAIGRIVSPAARLALWLRGEWFARKSQREFTRSRDNA